MPDQSPARPDCCHSGGLAQRFLPRLVHELRSPVRAIQYFLDAMDESLNGVHLPAEAAENLDVISSSSGELRDLTDSLAQFVRSLELPSDPLELHVAQCVALAWENSCSRGPLEGGRGRLAVDPSVAALVLVGDSSSLQSAIECVFDNCLRFADPARSLQVEVVARLSDTEQCLEIRDNGLGIEPAYIHKCYEAFERLLPRAKFGGAGLGIPTAVNFLQFLDGTLELQSDGAQYTKVILRFPA